MNHFTIRPCVTDANPAAQNSAVPASKENEAPKEKLLPPPLRPLGAQDICPATLGAKDVHGAETVRRADDLREQREVIARMLTSPRHEIFDHRQEFPNLFTLHFKNLSYEQRQKRLQLVADAVASILNRFELPTLDAETKGEAFVAYFNTISRALRKVTPEVNIYVNSDTMRAVMGYLYEKLYVSLQKMPDASPDDILKDIANDIRPIREEAANIFSQDSCFGLILDCSDPAMSPNGRKSTTWNALCDTADKINDTLIGRRAEDETDNTALKTGGFWTTAPTVHRREYVAEALHKGGSHHTTQGLYFGPKPIQSKANLEAIESYLCAPLKYASPAETLSQPERHSLMVEALIPLLETPFLEYSTEANQALCADVLKMVAFFEAGNEFDEEVMTQLNEVIGYARFYGTNNRVHRSESCDPLAAFLRLSNVVREKNKNDSPLADLFADRFPIEHRTRSDRDLNGFPEKLLMPVADFIEKRTVDGVFFHGRESLSTGLRINRGGMYISTESQGSAKYGTGVYATHEIGTSNEYTNDEGPIFHLAPRVDRPVNIVEWKKIEHSDFIRGLIEQKPELASVYAMFPYLSKHHGIDAVINAHILIENSEAFVVPNTLREVAAGYCATPPTPWMLENLDCVFSQYSKLWGFVEQTDSSRRASRAEPGLAAPSIFAQSIVRTALQNVKAYYKTLDFRDALKIAIEGKKFLDYFDDKQDLFEDSALFGELDKIVSDIVGDLPNKLRENAKALAALLEDEQAISAFVDLGFAMHDLGDLGLPKEELLREVSAEFLDALIEAGSVPSIESWWYVLRLAARYCPEKVEILFTTFGDELLDKPENGLNLGQNPTSHYLENILNRLPAGLSHSSAVKTWGSRFLASVLESQETRPWQDDDSALLSLVKQVSLGPELAAAIETRLRCRSDSAEYLASQAELLFSLFEMDVAWDPQFPEEMLTGPWAGRTIPWNAFRAHVERTYDVGWGRSSALVDRILRQAEETPSAIDTDKPYWVGRHLGGVLVQKDVPDAQRYIVAQLRQFNALAESFSQPSGYSRAFLLLGLLDGYQAGNGPLSEELVGLIEDAFSGLQRSFSKTKCFTEQDIAGFAAISASSRKRQRGEDGMIEGIADAIDTDLDRFKRIKPGWMMYFFQALANINPERAQMSAAQYLAARATTDSEDSAFEHIRIVARGPQTGV